MAIDQKVHSGTLLDIETREELASGQFEFRKQIVHDGLLKFTVIGLLNAYKPDLVERMCVLRITDAVEGQVQVGGIIPPPTRNSMKVKLILYGDFWKDPSWFEAI